MRFRWMSCLLAPHATLPAFFILTAAVCAAEGGAKPDGKIDFQRQIQPLLAKHCYECHGLETQEAGFRLDLRDKALLGGDSGPAIVPGDPAGSHLFDRITATDEDQRMPPTWSETAPLTPQAIELFRQWIVEGANWPAAFRDERITSDHWAYQPLGRSAPPEVKNTQGVRNGIDNFVFARLEAAGIDPSEEADRHTLIKRLYYDLVGLPPEPEHVDPFVDDRSPDAYEKLVDRLLASPRFGERWGRHWLDKARFADSDGYEKDNPRPDAWRWRDWVIDAVNRDMPFDEFTVRQLAGDLLPEAGPIDRLATAFHRQTLTNTEGGVDQEEFRVAAVKDRVDTTVAIWLGLTVGCAQCHSHKYDQITQREYYQLFAFFNNGDEATTEVPTSDEATAGYEEAKKKHDAKSADLAAKLADRREDLSKTLSSWEAKLGTKLESVPEKPVEFPPLEILSAKSDGGATLERLDDGSYLAGGANPDRATYTIIAKSDLGEISGVRLETLALDSLPQQGPGRVDHGNFVLSEIRVETSRTEDFKQIAAVEFAGAEADHAQTGWPPTAAIDGRTDTGWAVAPQFGRDHWAVFVAGSPLGSEGTQYLKITLSFQYGSRHTLGRFRLQARTGSKPSDRLSGEVLEALAAGPDRRSDEQNRALLHYALSQDSEGKKLLRDIAEHEKKEPRRPVVTARVIAQRCTEPRRNFVLNRGDFLQPTIEVSPNTLEVLPPLKPRSPEALPDRLDLAHWLVDPANPLPPRVAVNHIWAHLIGEGIVSTVDDFGVRGESPTHPELLDWLAGRFVASGWSRKEMIRLIVNSSTYRQSSRHRPEFAETDPRNKMLYRQNRFRVEAEIVRDAALAASGLLCDKVGGPSVFPPMPADVAALSYADNFKWKTSQGEDRYRRGMYTFFKRTAPHPNLVAFDCPDANTAALSRRTSNTPLQALTTLNNEVFVEAAQAMALLALTKADASTDEDRLATIFRRCVARPPSGAELQRLLDLLQTSRRWYAASPGDAGKLVGAHRAEGTPVEENAAWIVTARVVLNLDEMITRE